MVPRRIYEIWLYPYSIFGRKNWVFIKPNHHLSDQNPPHYAFVGLILMIWILERLGLIKPFGDY